MGADFGQFDMNQVAQGLLGVVGIPTVTVPSASRRNHSWERCIWIGGNEGHGFLLTGLGKVGAGGAPATARKGAQGPQRRNLGGQAVKPVLAVAGEDRLDDLGLEALVADRDVTSSPTATPQGRRARAMDCCRVGEKLPLVISPSPQAVRTVWWLRKTPLSSSTRPRKPRCWPVATRAARPTKSRSPSRGHRPGQAGVEGRCSRPCPGRRDSSRLPGAGCRGHPGRRGATPAAWAPPGRFGALGGKHDLVAVLAGVAGAGDEIVARLDGEEGFNSRSPPRSPGRTCQTLARALGPWTAIMARSRRG